MFLTTFSPNHQINIAAGSTLVNVILVINEDFFNINGGTFLVTAKNNAISNMDFLDDSDYDYINDINDNRNCYILYRRRIRDQYAITFSIKLMESRNCTLTFRLIKPVASESISFNIVTV